MLQIKQNLLIHATCQDKSCGSSQGFLFCFPLLFPLLVGRSDWWGFWIDLIAYVLWMYWQIGQAKIYIYSDAYIYWQFLSNYTKWDWDWCSLQDHFLRRNLRETVIFPVLILEQYFKKCELIWTQYTSLNAFQPHNCLLLMDESFVKLMRGFTIWLYLVLVTGILKSEKKDSMNHVSSWLGLFFATF